jgi:hypothetical protein
MKYLIVQTLQKYVLNPPIRLLFAAGLAPPGYALLETIGRKTESPGALQWETDVSAGSSGWLRSLV